MIDDDEIKKLRALCEAATKGPWTDFDRRRDVFPGDDWIEIRQRDALVIMDEFQESPCDECGRQHVNGCDRFHVATIKLPRERNYGCGKKARAAAHRACMADARFIAAARTALPAALDEIERLRAELAAVRADSWPKQYECEDPLRQPQQRDPGGDQ